MKVQWRQIFSDKVELGVFLSADDDVDFLYRGIPLFTYSVAEWMTGDVRDLPCSG
eukprot:CAMPEP_0185771540 /NCGR_PEP_ID=MMETSP1174-20130828/64368_1 /TAXON_ID=35687 /ORGANISM="Dictyocha speculum, Strain CCMP1381" /LENGTH=54 /DNA_ID=CAMNT_0028457433 /DNA_START=427 /DNA_END=591 /DNA_ORIENTATION=+